MEIESGSTGCENDNVTLYDGPDTQSSVINSYCGSTSPLPIRGTANVMTVVFKSDYSVTFSGFRISYTAVSVSESGSSGGNANSMQTVLIHTVLRYS